MKPFIFTSKEAAFLAAIKTDPEFSLSQATIWSNMAPTEVRDLVNQLESKDIVRNIDTDRFAFTDLGSKARRQLVRDHDNRFLISEAGLNSSEINSALGDAIDRLK